MRCCKQCARRFSTRHHVRHAGLLHGTAEAPHLVFALGSFQKNDVGPSAPIVNFLWGAFNLLVGVYLLSRHPVTVDFEPAFLALVLGALAIGIYLSLHFGKVGRDKSGR